MKKLIYIIIAGLVGLTTVFLNPSCTKYEVPEMIQMDGYDSDSVISTTIHRKVLWINMDGATGSVVEQAIPVNGTIAGMLKNSKYSWIGLIENRTLEGVSEEDPVTWATMLTGVIPEKHHINDNTYVANMDFDPTNPDEQVVQYPNILHHIAESNVENPTLCVTPWEKLNSNMLNAAQRTVTTTTDEESKNIVLESIIEEDFDFTLVSFKGMLEAGKSGGFTAGNSAYVSALQDIDGYIGEFLQAIGERENAFYEDWLVILTSNHGGATNGTYGGNSNEERNTFGLFYYPYYEEQRMLGEKMYGAYFEKGKTKAIVYDTVATDIRYAFGPDSPFSMEIVMRMLPRKDGTYNGNNWDYIITKGEPGGTGWGLFRQRSTVSFRFASDGSSLEQSVTGFNDPQWHTYGFSVTRMDGNREWNISLDGRGTVTGTNTTNGLLNDDSPLLIGNIPTPFYVSEIRLWKKALTPGDLTQQAAMLNISPSDNRFADLMAYWKFNPGEVKKVIDKDTLLIKNQVEGGLDLYFINESKSESRSIEEYAFVELPNTFPLYQQRGDLLMENTMVVPQILYWLNIAASTNLDGFLFLDNYKHSEEWRDEPEEIKTNV